MFSRIAVQDFALANKAYVGATVTFYTVDENGEKTNTLASLYSGIVGSQKLSNPQTLDSYGKFRQPVYIEDAVVGVVTGVGNTPDHETGIMPIATGRREAEYYADDVAITIDPVTFFHLIDTTAGNVTVTMPDPSEAIGTTVVIKRNTGGGNSLTINDIEGGNNVNLTTQNYYLMLYSNGSDWFIIAERRS
jgi:hypothetical protein